MPLGIFPSFWATSCQNVRARIPTLITVDHAAHALTTYNQLAALVAVPTMLQCRQPIINVLLKDDYFSPFL